MLQAIRFLLSGVCHQLPAHSYWAGGQPLPLCARCSGTFLGIWVGLLTLRWMGHHRRTGMPSGPAAWVLGALAVLWALDGANSFLADALGRPLYPPTNLLRLISGAGMGVALGAVVAPMCALAFAHDDKRPVARSAYDVLALLAGAGSVVVVVSLGAGLSPILWSLALGAATVGAVALLNALLVRLAVAHWPRWAVGVAGVVLALGEMGAIAGLRGLIGI